VEGSPFSDGSCVRRGVSSSDSRWVSVLKSKSFFNTVKEGWGMPFPLKECSTLPEEIKNQEIYESP
jgi:hypothetical protein